MESKNLYSRELEDIYVESLLKEKIIIESKNLNHKINDYIYDYLKKKVENRCISEGFIKENSIKIIDKSIGYIRNSRFYGEVTYDILFKAMVCCPVAGDIIDCRVKFVNKLGILGSNGPLLIIVGRQFHRNEELLDNINPDDIIKVEIIDKKYSINDNQIKIIAKIKTNNDNYSDKNDLTLGDISDIEDNDEFADKTDSLFGMDDTKEIDKDLEEDDILDDLEDDDEDEDLDEEDEDIKELMINGINDELQEDELDDIPEDEETLDDDDYDDI